MRSHLAARNAVRRCLVHGPDSHGLFLSTTPATSASPSQASASSPSPSTISSCSFSTQRSSRVCSHSAHRLQGTPQSPSVRAPLPPPAARSFSTTPRRPFLGSFRKPPPRELKEQQVEPGYDVLLQYRASIAEDTRPPPREELVQAFRDFFSYKYQYGKRVNATQAQWFRRLFVYLREEAGGISDEELSLDDLRTAREALSKPPTTSSSNAGSNAAQDHLGLCREIFSELRRRRVDNPIDFKLHIGVLCQYGASLEAVQLLAEYLASATTAKETRGAGGPAGAGVELQAQAPAGPKRTRREKELLVLVLRGLAKEGQENALLAEAAAAEAAGLEYMPVFHEIMTTFYARQNNFYKTKLWFEKPIHDRQQPTAQTYAELLAFSQRTTSNSTANGIVANANGPPGSTASNILTEKRNWIHATFQSLCDSNPSKDKWDVIYQWAVISLDKGVDDIRHMITTMHKHNGNRPDMAPDAATINGLVRVAAARGDALLAERFIQLGASDQFDIAPDANTFILQLDYRINANDLSGAYASFVHLQSFDCPDEEDAAVVNKYLHALCEAAKNKAASAAASSSKNPTSRIRDVLDTAEDRQIALEPATVVSLCMTFLDCDQQYEVIDVLSVHAMQYSVDERAVVRDAFVQYIVDRRHTSTARAWDAYSLLRQYFAETPPASRKRIMDGFFRRRRADMACYVFGHMRAANDPALRPTADMYVRCLEGLGKYPDATGLRMVHNMLKMDTRVQLNTQLHNALMLAYAASGDAARALDFWHEINSSREGPSYSSLAILFWACEKLPFGDAPARSVWAKLQRMEIDVPPAVSDAYAGALAGQGLLEEVQKLIGSMEKSLGYGPTLATLGIACNALPGQDLQAEFASWAAEEYPDVWQQVKKQGCTTTVMGLRRYKSHVK